MAAPDSVQAPFWRPGLARVCVPAAALFFLALVTIGNLPGLAAQMSDAYGDKRLAAYATLTCRPTPRSTGGPPCWHSCPPPRWRAG